MEKLIELYKKDDILVSSTVLSNNKPDYVYIPILENSKILVRRGEAVKIGSPIIKTNNKMINSSVSGTVTSIKKVNTITNHLIDAIEIANDFEEKHVKEIKAKKISSLKKERIQEVLNDFSIEINPHTTLVLNCVDDEPYVLTENFYLFLNTLEYLELLDKLASVYELDQVRIVIKSSSSNNINQLMNYLGMFTNISLNIVPDLYLLEREQFLIRYLSLKEEKTTVIKASDLYHINNILKKNKTISDVLITISGNNIKNPSIVKVRIGEYLKTALNELIKEEANSVYIGNGLMKGKIIDPENLVITKEIKSILIMKKEKTVKEEKCINCGACIDICPVSINPILLEKKEYRERVKEKCISCGLCSYICPAHINFNKKWHGDENE